MICENQSPTPNQDTKVGCLWSYTGSVPQVCPITCIYINSTQLFMCGGSLESEAHHSKARKLSLHMDFNVQETALRARQYVYVVRAKQAYMEQ